MNNIKVLSLFDGISCGRVALERVGIQIDKYFASEIDKYAIQVSKKNYPDIVHIGSVLDVKGEDYKDIDLLIGGSPCQSFSIAGKQEGFDGKSGLFYEYLRILKEVNPKYFLLENVKMKKEWQDVISKELGCEPIEINSSLMSAQSRKRLYWTNIPGIQQPKDKNIFLKDILEDTVDEKYFYEHKLGVTINGTNALRKEKGSRRTVNQKAKCTTAGGQGITNAGATNISIGGRLRKVTPLESERLQTLPDNYTEGVSNTQRYKAIGNGWTVDVIAHIFFYLKHD